MKKLVLTSLILLFYNLFCYSQIEGFLEFIEPESQASFGEVRSITQDETGRIWIGIFGKGLAYYDGQKIKRFPLSNDGDFSDKLEIFHENEGDLYLNLSDAIQVFNPILQEITDTIKLSNSLDVSGNIHSLVFDDEDDIIYALYKLNSQNQELEKNEFIILKSKNDGDFQILTNHVISAFGQLLFKKMPEGFLVKSESALDYYNDDFKLIESYPVNNDFRISDLNPFNVSTDDEGEIGLLDYHPGGMNKYFITSDSIEQIKYINQEVENNYQNYKDKNGILWIGSHRGLIKFVERPPVFKLMPPLTSRSFVEDDDGFIYAGEDVNLNIYNPENGNVKKIPHPKSFWYSAAIKDNYLYYSNSRLNINDFKKEPVILYPSINGTISNRIMRNGELWKTAWSSSQICIYPIPRIDTCRCTQIPQLKDAEIDINDLYQRPSDGTVWLGTFGKGVFVFSEEGDLINHYSISTSSDIVLNNNIVCSFQEDSKGNMWLGHGNGMSKINTNTNEIKHYPVDPQKPDFYLVYGILPENDERHLWLSTNKGIFRFDTEEGTFFDFPLNPTIMDLEYNRTSYLKTRAGEMYFGSNENVVFYPEEVMEYYNKVNDAPSNIIIHSIKKYNPEIGEVKLVEDFLQIDNTLQLLPKERYFEIEFSTDDFRSIENNYFTWFLENYDDNWQKAQKINNRIKYENLKPGTYYLHMRSGLIPSELYKNERVLKIEILPAWYQTWWAYLLFGGAFLGIVYSIYRYELNRRLEKEEGERIKELDALKTRLFNNLTHEFRTPLTVIMGMAENIPDEFVEKNLISRNSQHLLQMINQMLDLAKLDAKQMKIHQVNGNIIEYLREFSESFQVPAKNKGIKLTFNTSEQELMMDYDSSKMQNIIYNLLSNAIKFTEKGGEIDFRLDKVLIDNQPQLQIIIKDTGIGISPEKIPHVFDRFYQADNTSTRKGEGTGIGLALVKELVDLLKGTIQVESLKNQGTTFKIQLPITNNLNPEEETYIPQAAIVHPEEAPTVQEEITDIELPLLLIIEDNNDIITYIKTILEKDYRIITAENGEIGIEKAIESIPEIVITDVMMPIKDGYEVVDTLKQDIRTSHIPIVMLTAKTRHSDKIKGLKLGADAYLNKPFHKDELMVRLEKLVEIRKKLQSIYSNSETQLETKSDDNPLENEFITKLKTAINENLDDTNFGIPELAKSVFMSQMQVYRKLKALTGKTPSQFMRSIKLHHAKELIKTSDLNITQVAFEVGFSDPNYFSKVFNEKYGVSPSQFRKNF